MTAFLRWLCAQPYPLDPVVRETFEGLCSGRLVIVEASAQLKVQATRYDRISNTEPAPDGSMVHPEVQNDPRT